MLLLPKEQTGEAWGIFQKTTFVLKSRRAGKKAEPTSLLQYVMAYGIALKLIINF
jgi:hypothetical protein